MTPFLQTVLAEPNVRTAYYAERDDDERGKAALKRVYGNVDGYDLQVEYAIIKNTIIEEVRSRQEYEQANLTPKQFLLSYMECFKSSNIRRTMGAALPGCAQQLAGLSFLNTYASLFFKQSGFSNAFLITTVLCKLLRMPLGKGFTNGIVDRHHPACHCVFPDAANG
jgi:hypothetical protein